MERFKWEVHCCNRSSDIRTFPEPIKQTTVYVYADDEEMAMEKARELVKREHYQVIEVEEEVQPAFHTHNDPGPSDQSDGQESQE